VVEIRHNDVFYIYIDAFFLNIKQICINLLNPRHLLHFCIKIT